MSTMELEQVIFWLALAAWLIFAVVVVGHSLIYQARQRRVRRRNESTANDGGGQQR